MKITILIILQIVVTYIFYTKGWNDGVRSTGAITGRDAKRFRENIKKVNEEKNKR